MSAPTLYRCHCDCGCEEQTEAPVLMREHTRPTGPAWTLYVCPNCAHHMAPSPLKGELEPGSDRF
ncbi:hypothetical protein OK074_3305 [Actinobacteria bacterium OK074]|nr:hypothetical protein OK074_3305 [Actinobacteria bacterium OK074]